MLNDSTIDGFANHLRLSDPSRRFTAATVTTVVFVVLGLMVFAITFLLSSKLRLFRCEKNWRRIRILRWRS